MEGVLQKRNYSLDVMRIVAVFAVVMIHCSGSFVANYSPVTIEFVIGNLLNSISRIGVPLFLMISGSLFLDEHKEITVKNILSKNVKSMAIITLVWAVIYAMAYKVALPFLRNEAVDIKNVIEGIATGHYHMWYLYMIMGIYLITPFLKKFVCEKNKELVLLFIIISFCAQFLAPVINAMSALGMNLSFINSWIEQFNLGFFNGYITYYLAGWYIVHIGIKQKWLTNLIYLLGAMALVSIIVFVQFTGDRSNAYANIGAPVFIYSVSVFLALNNIKWKFKENTNKKVVELSKLTFGVYIIHVMVLTACDELLPYSQNSAVYLLVRFAVVACSSFLASYIISKIPVAKKIIKA